MFLGESVSACADLVGRPRVFTTGGGASFQEFPIRVHSRGSLNCEVVLMMVRSGGSQGFPARAWSRIASSVMALWAAAESRWLFIRHQ